jgi:hypothetical protein
MFDGRRTDCYHCRVDETPVDSHFLYGHSGERASTILVWRFFEGILQAVTHRNGKLRDSIRMADWNYHDQLKRFAQVNRKEEARLPNKTFASAIRGCHLREGD